MCSHFRSFSFIAKICWLFWLTSQEGAISKINLVILFPLCALAYELFMILFIASARHFTRSKRDNARVWLFKFKMEVFTNISGRLEEVIWVRKRSGEYSVVARKVFEKPMLWLVWIGWLCLISWCFDKKNNIFQQELSVSIQIQHCCIIYKFILCCMHCL